MAKPNANDNPGDEFTAKIVRGGMLTIPNMVRYSNNLKVGDIVRLKLLAVVGEKKVA